MNRPAPGVPIDPRILEQASDWLVQLHGGGMTDEARAAFQRWRQSDPEHDRAWARAELLMNKLGGLPPSLAMPSLDRPARGSRRAAIARLAMLAATVPAGWAAWRLARHEGWAADHRTRTGERRDLRLADGTRLMLNTATAIDVRFDATQRLIHLRAGEILIQTAPDSAPVRRPFLVGTGEGRMEALGTRFSVRQDEGRTTVAVFENAVRIEPRGASPAVLEAGHRVSFTASGLAAPAPADEAAIAWTRGMLLADRMLMADVVAEVARYRGGIVRCDPAIADIPVSGAFPIADTDRTLGMLAATYPVRAVTRAGGYWVSVVPR
ncbi:FecR domain-containing protein [Pigmentiphaga sp. YJ18]|uniref:FecR domain-containing protein n=1 Tax=Pigmentiphaga sp. YJ18 TaxID=3134907 RepID=UPI00310F2CBE